MPSSLCLLSLAQSLLGLRLILVIDNLLVKLMLNKLYKTSHDHPVRSISRIL